VGRSLSIGFQLWWGSHGQQQQLLVDEPRLDSFAHDDFLFVNKDAAATSVTRTVLGLPTVLWAIGSSSLRITNRARRHSMLFRDAGGMVSLDRNGLKPLENFGDDPLSPAGGELVLRSASRRNEELATGRLVY
jgi:hypothetical protein